MADGRMREHFPALVDAARVVGSVQIRNRATLIGNICNASPAADTAPALLAYAAAVNIAGAGGERRVPLTAFFQGPGRTVLGRDELVTSIDLPLPSGPVGAAFMRLTRRRGVDLATLTVCCTVARSGEVRTALGAVAPTPLLVTGVDAAELRGGPDRQQQTIARIAAHASPISDVRAGQDYRSAMLAVFIGRALDLALKRLDENVTWNPPDSLSSSQ
jgi:carbon-monoxide dehydrogenase medium subunit